MPVCDQYRCIFVHIPRTGGSSVEKALMLHNEGHRENLATLTGWVETDAIREYGFTSPVLQHLTLSDIHRLLPRDRLHDWFKFCFVRNPWERMLSVYLFDRAHYEHRHGTRAGYPPLPEYLKKLHPFQAIQQCDYIDSDPGMDFVGRFETLEKDFAYVAQRIGLNGVTLPHVNRTRHQHYSSYYCDEARAIVAQLFPRDITRFDYRFDVS